MRTIKFRAWHKINKIMYWWDIIWGNHARGDGYIGMAPWGEDRHTPGSYRGNMVLIDPDNCEIMQFTGLTDKNGREIYEGDVINVKHYGWGTSEYENCVVEWDEIGFFPWTDVSAQIDIDYSASREPDKIEVIGNIYETPNY